MLGSLRVMKVIRCTKAGTVVSHHRVVQESNGRHTSLVFCLLKQHMNPTAVAPHDPQTSKVANHGSGEPRYTSEGLQEKDAH